MAFEYAYDLYNPGQYPDEMAKINLMAAAGWRAHTVATNYNELYIFWERELPEAEVKAEVKPGKPAKGKEESKSPSG